MVSTACDIYLNSAIDDQIEIVFLIDLTSEIQRALATEMSMVHPHSRVIGLSPRGEEADIFSNASMIVSLLEFGRLFPVGMSQAEFSLFRTRILCARDFLWVTSSVHSADKSELDTELILFQRLIGRAENWGIGLALEIEVGAPGLLDTLWYAEDSVGTLSSDEVEIGAPA